MCGGYGRNPERRSAVLIDTSAWIETLRTSGDPAIRARVSAVTADDRAVLCDLVLVELWNGARASKEHRLFREMEEQLETVPTTPEVWALARELARLARSKGLTVPATHHDSHFDQLAKLRAASS